jgi:hypothetical protein
MVDNTTSEVLTQEWADSTPGQSLVSYVTPLYLKAGSRVDVELAGGGSNIPPWLAPNVEIHTDLIEPIPKKSEVSPHILLALAEETLATRHPNANLIFTDGSVLTDGRTGAGIFIPDLGASFPLTLTSSTSILAAEMTAIINALDHHQKDTPAAITVVTDSMSALQALAGGQTDARPACSR